MSNYSPKRAKNNKTAIFCGFRKSSLRIINDIVRIIITERDSFVEFYFHMSHFFLVRGVYVACSAPRACGLSEHTDWSKSNGSESGFSSRCFLFWRQHG